MDDAQISDRYSAAQAIAREAGDLATVLDLTPGEELKGEEPGGLESDAFERHELAYEFESGVMSRGLETLPGGPSSLLVPGRPTLPHSICRGRIWSLARTALDVPCLPRSRIARR